MSDIKVGSLDANVNVEVSVTVTNTGSVAGSQTVQVYVSYPAIDLSVPRYQLRGFAKVRDLQPRETRQVSIKLNRNAFSVWDTRKNGWRVNAGGYEVHVGTSSEDLVGKGIVQVDETIHWYGI
jgi:beta-glucosidase